MLMNGEVVLGCGACRDCGRNCVFSRFMVDKASQFQLGNLRAHHRSECHQRCVAKRFGIEWNDFRVLVLKEDKGFMDSVPRPLYFAWAIHCAHAGTSHSKFTGFMEMNQIPSNSSVHVLQDQSKRAVRQMLCAVSFADRDANCLPVLRKAVRIAQACDDRDQNFSLRYRAVTTDKKIRPMTDGVVLFETLDFKMKMLSPALPDAGCAPVLFTNFGSNLGSETECPIVLETV